MPAERGRSEGPRDTVVPLTKDQVPTAALVVATALADDPGYRHLMPDDRRRVGELAALYRMTLADTLAYGRGFVTTLGSVVTGALAVYPPGRYPMTVARWLRSGVRLAGIAATAREHSVGLIRFGRLTVSSVPAEPWYFQVLGVRPDMQHTGRGTALLRTALALVDESGDASYLETTRPENVAYYEHLGYRPIREPVPLAPGGPWIHPMLRAAHPS